VDFVVVVVVIVIVIVVAALVSVELDGSEGRCYAFLGGFVLFLI
jgi:hypothetical protein